MDSIEEARVRLTERLEELRPFVDEARRIEQLLASMDTLAEERHSPSPDSVTGAAKRLPAESRKLHILALLRDRGELRVKELAEALEVTPGRVVQLVDDLEAAGTARRVEGGVEITSAGLDLVPPQIKITFGGIYKVAAVQ
jgi:MarR family